MTVSLEFSTADVNQGRFSAHGLVTVKVAGNVARYEATGPFNEELVTAYIAMQEKVISKMMERGRWGALSVLYGSVMASLWALDVYSKDLKACALQGLAPCATAFVMTPDVEGALIMGSVFAKIYSDAGLPFMVFTNSKEAEAWFQSALTDAELCR